RLGRRGWNCGERQAVVVAPAITSGTGEVATPLATRAGACGVQRPVDPAIIALTVIGAGIVLRFGWLFLAFIRLRRFAGQTRCIAPPECAEEVQARVGAAARYLEHPTAGSPSTFGIFRPSVVLPSRFSTLS